MTVDVKQMKKKHKLLGIAFSALSLAILIYVAIALISGRGLNLTWLTNLFSARTPVVIADEYHFDVGRDRVFARLDGTLVAAGSLGIQVLDLSGGELLRHPFRMSHSAIAATGGRAIAFDIGGSAAHVFSSNQIIASKEVSGVIVSASINQNGWFCLSTQDGMGYRGITTVYNNTGNAVYEVYKGTGYILSAELSPDNRSLAVLNLTSSGSRITFYHGLNKEEADGVFDLRDGLIIDIRYLSGGNVLAISTNSLIIVNRDGVGEEIFDFSDVHLGGFDFDDGFILLHLLDYAIGNRGRIVILRDNGTLVGEVPTDREIVSMSFDGGSLAVLHSDSLVFFSIEHDEFSVSAEYASASGANSVLTIGDGAVVAVGDHSAVVFREERGDAGN